MSVSLLEVLNAAGYDLTKKEDALWLLGVQSEFDELVEQADELVYEDEMNHVLNIKEGKDV